MKVSEDSTWVFKLYIAGDSPNSRLAVSNLETLCQDYLPDCSQVEIIDVLELPMRIFEDNIIVTPTLIKISPEPRSILMGNLSDLKRVLLALGLDSQTKE